MAQNAMPSAPIGNIGFLRRAECARSVMNVLQRASLSSSERTRGDNTQTLHIGFGYLDGTIGVDLLDHGDMPIVGISALLAGLEHHDVAHMARRAVHPVAQRAGAGGPLTTVTEAATNRQTQLGAALIGVPRALTPRVSV